MECSYCGKKVTSDELLVCSECGCEVCEDCAVDCEVVIFCPECDLQLEDDFAEED